MTKPEQTPTGALLSQEIKRKGLSQREVARQANLSEGRLRQILNGYASVGHGQYIPVSAPPATVARIALVLNLTTNELGRVDLEAASELHNMTRPPGPTDEDIERSIRRSQPGWDMSDQDLIDELARRLSERIQLVKATPEPKEVSDAGDAEAQKIAGPGDEWPRAAREGDGHLPSVIHFAATDVDADTLPRLMLALDYDGREVLNPRLAGAYAAVAA